MAWACDTLVVGASTNATQLGLYVLAFSLAVGYWVWRHEVASRIGTWYLTPEEGLTAAGAWYAGTRDKYRPPISLQSRKAGLWP